VLFLEVFAIKINLYSYLDFSYSRIIKMNQYPLNVKLHMIHIHLVGAEILN